MNQRTKSLLIATGLASLAAPGLADDVDIRFFGDVYIPSHVLARTTSEAGDSTVFSGMRDLLDGSRHNVVNFEGVATDAFVAHEPKRFLLKMPSKIPALLRDAGLDVVTLANNHSMDFGYQGLFDTLLGLDAAGIGRTGAGVDLAAAARPVHVAGEEQTYCVLAFSKTLPESFWARGSRAGTAVADLALLTSAIESCAVDGFVPVVTFHWGQEGSRKSQSYQRAIARHAIDHGARLVIGHHPHVLQEFEIYRGRPILYSLGNFAFGTTPTKSLSEGLAVGLKVEGDGSALALVLTPLMVDNDVIGFRPRPLQGDERDPLADQMPAGHPCVYDKEKRHWVCLFDDRES